MSNTNKEEIDLGVVFRKLNDGYHNFLAGIYKATRFIVRHWIILLIIIVGGYLLGKFWASTSPDTHTATLIVQNNFGSSGYVYSAVELLNVKYQQEDQQFLKKYGFDAEMAELSEITIEPIVDIIELLELTETSDRSLDLYVGALSVEEDILLSEVFYPQYKYHRIYITVSGDNYRNTIAKVIDYLNSNTLYNETRDVVVEETRLRIRRNDSSIQGIDDIFNEFSGKNQEVANPSQMYFKTLENNDLHQLLEIKTELIKENEKLKKELLKYDSTVKIINYPEFIATATFLDKKSILLPLVLLFLYILFFVMRGLYLAGKRYAKT